jgi:DNA polymerase
MNKEKKMEKLNKKMLACKKCALRKGCNQVVPGEGSANAKIMFIGEGPGKKEDDSGIPFVGASGKFLDEMLNSIKLERKDVYIANTVKCRPPANRDPLPAEKETCWPWLEKQIKLIDPDLIVTLGKHSMEELILGKKISEVHGKFFRRDFSGLGNQNLFVLYHPAAALYNGSMRKVLIKDFKKIPKILKIIDKKKE